LDRARLQWDDRLIGEHGVKHCATPNAARERPETVERERERHAAVERHATLRRLIADDAVIGGRNPAGAAGIGTESAMRHTIDNGHRRARRRSTGYMP